MLEGFVEMLCLTECFRRRHGLPRLAERCARNSCDLLGIVQFPSERNFPERTKLLQSRVQTQYALRIGRRHQLRLERSIRFLGKVNSLLQEFRSHAINDDKGVRQFLGRYRIAIKTNERFSFDYYRSGTNSPFARGRQ